MWVTSLLGYFIFDPALWNLLLAAINFSLPYMFWVCVVSIALILLVNEYFKYKDWRNGWLSKLIKEESKRIEKQEKKESIRYPVAIFKNPRLTLYQLIESRFLKDRIIQDLKQFWLPSFSSLVVMLGIFFLIYHYGHKDIPYRDILKFETWKNFQQSTADVAALENIIAILAGFTSVVFALVIFVAESIRDNKNYEQKRVLLKVSNLWILITINVLALLNFLWFDVNILSLVFPAFIGALVVFSFWRVVLNLIDAETQRKSQIEFLTERIKRSIYETVRERIGNGILLNKLGKDKEIKIEYSVSKRWIEEKEKDYIFIKSRKAGWISDINLEVLNQLAKRLETSAQRLGFSLYNSAPPIGAGAQRAQGETAEQARSGEIPVKTAYIFKRFADSLPEDTFFQKEDNVVFGISKKFREEKGLIKDIEDLIPSIFSFKKDEPTSAIFRKELQGTKDQLVSAIKATALGEIEELKEIYLHIAEVFLETLDKFGGGYSAEQAKNERTSLFFSDGWDEVEWLRRDFRELITIAIETKNREVIQEIIFLPTAISIRAIQAKDHFLFQEFTPFSQIIYYLTEDLKESKLKNFLKERSWLYLKEISDLYIEVGFREEETPEGLDNYKDFAIYILQQFQLLIKAAFASKDEATYQQILSEFVLLYKHIKPEQDNSSIVSLQFSLSQTSSEAEKEEINNRITLAEKRSSIAKELKLSKEQVIFGLSSYIFEKYRLQNDNVEYKKFFDSIFPYLPANLERLTEIYVSSRNFKTEDAWGWDNWEMEEKRDGEVHSIDVSSKLDRLYAVSALKKLSTLDTATLESIKLPPSRDLAFQADAGQTLASQLGTIQSNPEEWSFILNEDELVKIDKLKDLLKTVKEEQEANEEEIKKNSPLDAEKLSQFKKGLEKGIAETAHLRQVVKKLDAYEDLTQTVIPHTELPSFGYNQVHDKEAFIKDWHVSHYGLGEQFGRGIGNSENETVFGQIADGLEEKRVIQKDSIFDEIEKTISEKSIENPIVLQTLDHEFEYDQIRKSELFIPYYSQSVPKTKFSGISGFMGVIKLGNRSVPVIDTFVWKENLKNKIIITDINKLGRWLQYSPITQSADEPYRNGFFSLRIADLNIEDELRNKIITENPTWLQREATPEAHLRKLALIRVFEKLKFDVRNPSVGACLTISDTSSSAE